MKDKRFVKLNPNAASNASAEETLELTLHGARED